MSELDDAVVTARLRKATMEAALADERTRLEQPVADFIDRMNGAANPGASHIQCDVVVVRGRLIRRRHHEIVRLPDLGWRVGDAGLRGVADVLTIRGEWFDRAAAGSAAGWVRRGTLTAELPAEPELAHQRVSDTLNLLGRLLENNLPPEDLPSGRLRHTWRAFNERDKQSSPRRSVRWLASWGFALPPLVGLLFLVGLFLGRVTSLSQGFLSASAQVLPTLVLALAVQVGLTFTRFAAPLREGRSVVLLGPSAINDFADALRQTSKDPSWSTFVTYWRAARRLRVLVDLKYVSVGFGVRVHPAVVAVLSVLVVFALLAVGEARVLLALAHCSNQACPISPQRADSVVAGYVAGAALIVYLLCLDLLPRLAALASTGQPGNSTSSAGRASSERD